MIVNLAEKILELHAPVPNHGRYSGDHPCVQGECHHADGEPKVCAVCRTYTGEEVEYPCDTATLVRVSQVLR